jgi:hypothetical protein
MVDGLALCVTDRSANGVVEALHRLTAYPGEVAFTPPAVPRRGGVADIDVRSAVGRG